MRVYRFLEILRLLRLLRLLEWDDTASVLSSPLGNAVKENEICDVLFCIIPFISSFEKPFLVDSC